MVATVMATVYQENGWLERLLLLRMLLLYFDGKLVE